MSLILLAALAAAPSSSYTPLDLDACEIVTVAHAGEGDWVNRRCRGLGGITLFVNEDDARFDLDAGIDNGEWESPAQLNELGPQLEWRREGGRAFAVIYRYTIPEALPGGRSMLAVESIGRRGRPGCLVALLLATPNANARARQIADTRARSFRCGRDRRITDQTD
ncbi:MAG TPA: hypothetical protein VEC11_06335 [Allosphingosinicella sp.]|nr:hypothetical protein [Allosphingosinicella sp.]